MLNPWNRNMAVCGGTQSTNQAKRLIKTNALTEL